MTNDQTTPSDRLLQALRNVPILPDEETDPPCAVCNGELAYTAIDAQTGVSRRVFCTACPEGRAHAHKVWEQRLDASRLPKLYKDATFATWDAMPPEYKVRKQLAREAAEQFVIHVRLGNVDGFRLSTLYTKLGAAFPLSAEDDTPRLSIVFYGPVGTSKTGLAAAILNALMGDTTPIYVGVEDLFERLTRAIRQSEDTEQIVSTIKTAPVLVLDEWTCERVSDYRKETMNDILRARMFNRQPTLITTNHTAAELRAVWGERVLDPVESGAHWIPLGGVNLRPKTHLRPEDVP